MSDSPMDGRLNMGLLRKFLLIATLTISGQLFAQGNIREDQSINSSCRPGNECVRVNGILRIIGTKGTSVGALVFDGPENDASKCTVALLPNSFYANYLQWADKNVRIEGIAFVQPADHTYFNYKLRGRTTTNSKCAGSLGVFVTSMQTTDGLIWDSRNPPSE